MLDEDIIAEARKLLHEIKALKEQRKNFRVMLPRLTPNKHGVELEHNNTMSALVVTVIGNGNYNIEEERGGRLADQKVLSKTETMKYVTAWLDSHK